MELDKNINIKRVISVDRLVHEPARYGILALLYVVESADFIFIQHQTGLTPGNLSAHIKKLENANYITVKKTYKGRIPRTILSLAMKGQTAFEKYRKDMKSIFDDHR